MRATSSNRGLRPTAGLVFAAVLASAPAVADDDVNPDRPGIADGSQVVGARRFQVEAGLQYEVHDAGDTRDRLYEYPLLLRLGLGDRWEARVEVNAYDRERVAAPNADAQRSDGASPVSLGFKYQWKPFGTTGAGDAAPLDERPTVGTIVRVFPVSGSSHFRSDHVTGDVRLAADWDFAPRWSLNPNVGIGAYEDDAGHTYTTGLFALTLSYSPTHRTSLFVDTGMQSSEHRHGSPAVLVDGGLAWTVSSDVAWDLSFGKRTAGTSVPRRFVATGLSKRF